MSIFKRLFGGLNNKANSDTGPIPKRGLKLQFPPIPENGQNFAQQFVSAVKKNEGVRLDYSVDTLKFVDNFLQRFREEGLSVNDFAETIFVAGSYVGQVMVANNNGKWISHMEVNLPRGVSMMPLVVKLPNGNIADPIAKAFKRFHNGEIDSLNYFYQVFTKENN
jgi:hypothetical protein